MPVIGLIIHKQVWLTCTTEGCRCGVLIITSCGNVVQGGQIQVIMKDTEEWACEMCFWEYPTQLAQLNPEC